MAPRANANKRQSVLRIKDVWGNMVIDLNFRKHPYGEQTRQRITRTLHPKSCVVGISRSIRQSPGVG